MRTRVRAAILDVASVLLFVLIGRRSHDEGGSYLAETAKVAASFLIAVVAAWIVAQAWRAPRTLRTGVIVWVVTVAGGLALRPVFGRDVPLSFAIVTAIFLGLAIVGWRAVFAQVSRRRAR